MHGRNDVTEDDLTIDRHLMQEEMEMYNDIEAGDYLGQDDEEEDTERITAFAIGQREALERERQDRRRRLERGREVLERERTVREAANRRNLAKKLAKMTSASKSIARFWKKKE